MPFNTGREGTRQRVQDMMKHLQEQPAEVTEYDEQLVRRLIEKVTEYSSFCVPVFDEKFVVNFKSGTSVNVGR